MNNIWSGSGISKQQNPYKVYDKRNVYRNNFVKLFLKNTTSNDNVSLIFKSNHIYLKISSVDKKKLFIIQILSFIVSFISIHIIGNILIVVIRN
jgi:hypothetical protein